MSTRSGIAAAARGALRRMGMAFGGAMFFGIPALLLCVMVTGFVEDVRRATTFRRAEATVTRVEGRELEAERLTVTYQFAVNGETYTGRLEADEDDAEFEALRNYTVGQTVSIYYDPANPTDTCEAVGLNGHLPGIVMFLLPFLAVGASLLVGAVTGRELLPPKTDAYGRGLGGTPFAAFAIASAVCGIVQLVLSALIPWPVDLVVGLVLLFGVLPAVTCKVARSVRSKGRPAEAPHEMPRPSDRLGSLAPKLAGALAATCFWCGITGLFLGATLHGIAKQIHAGHRFLAVEGEVIRSEVHGESDSDSTTYSPRIKYRYSVGGRDYVSKRYAFGMAATSNRAYAKEIVDEYPPGSKVTVYYDPGDPKTAILDLAIPGISFFLLLFLQPFLLIGLGMIAWVIRMPMRHWQVKRFLDTPARVPWRIPTWGTLRSDAGGLSIRSRPRRLLGLLKGFAVGYGAVCFVGIFIVGFFFLGFGRPNPASVAIAFGIAAAAGAVTATISVRRAGESRRLLIDETLSRLELIGPRGEMSVAFSDIQAWTCKLTANPRRLKQSGDPEMVPALCLLTRDGRDVPAHVFEADDNAVLIAPKAAEGFAHLTRSTYLDPDRTTADQEDEDRQDDASPDPAPTSAGPAQTQRPPGGCPDNHAHPA